MPEKEIIEISRNRVYIEPLDDLLPGITHIGRLDFNQATQALEPHTHGGAVEFCYLDRGIAFFQSKQQQWQLSGGSCFVSYPDEVHGTGSHPLEKMKLYWIGFRPEKIIPWLAGDSSNDEVHNLENALFSLPRIFTGDRRMAEAISRAIDAYTGRHSIRTIIMKSALLELFIMLSEKKNKPGIISEKINNVISYINNNIDSEIKLKECAEMAQISLSRFKTRFKEETGIPPGEFILRKKIDKSTELLGIGLSVLDTSIECGFSSSQYFATVFKRYKNDSPTGWLKKQSIIANESNYKLAKNRDRC